MKRLDDAVRRILRIKFRAGLFDNPYVDPTKADAAQLLPDAVAAARKAAGRSMVLLKNEGNVLPLKRGTKTAVIGPLGDSKHDMLGPWWGRGDDKDAVSRLRRHQGRGPRRDVHAGLHGLQPRAAAVRPGAGLPESGRRGGARSGERRRPGRARARRVARDERRGRLAQRDRPAG